MCSQDDDLGRDLDEDDNGDCDDGGDDGSDNDGEDGGDDDGDDGSDDDGEDGGEDGGDDDSDDGGDSEDDEVVEEDENANDDDDYLGSPQVHTPKKMRFTTSRVIEVLERTGITNRNAAMLFQALILDNHTKSRDVKDYVLDYNSIRRARISYRRKCAAQVTFLTKNILLLILF